MLSALAHAGPEIATVNGTVRALVVWQNDLVAGGDFTLAGGVQVQHVARWDGSRWHALETGTDGPVHALAAYEGKLFVGGEFASAGGVAARNVAMWDGSGWHALGAGANGPVHALATQFGLFVFAGGSFDEAGGVTVNNVAEWFNGAWRRMGDGLDGSVECMTLLNATVVAAGNFQIAGRPIGDRQIASFSPTGWVPENQAILDGLIHAVADANGTLVAGGVFRQVWWQTTGISVGRKVGPRWQPLSLGLSQGALLEPGEVWALAAYAGGVAAGGLFSLADGLAAQNVAFHDGSVWTPLGAGVDGAVLAFAEYQGDLVVGGSFTTAGGLDAANIASWNGVAWSNELTPLALEDLHVHAGGDGVRLQWRLPEASLGTWRDVTVQRAAHASGPFADLGQRLRPATSMTWLDESVESRRSYWYRLRFEPLDGEAVHVGPVRVESAGVELAIGVLQAFDPGAGQPIQVRYRLGRAARVHLAIYDARGRVVRMLESGAHAPGEHVRTWNRDDAQGRTVARGTYFVHLEAGTTRSSRRLVLLSR